MQNNAMFFKVLPCATDMEWYAELQPLAAKDGVTVATAIATIVRTLLLVCQDAARSRAVRRIRVARILIGDALNTNENAAKRVLHFMSTEGVVEGVDYRLVVLKCSSHQSNLVVVVAIAGGKASNVLDTCELCGTLSRLYKYLLPSYLEDFTARLRDIVLRRFSVHSDESSDATRAGQQENVRLPELYGSYILPAELMAVMNRSVTRMQHVGPPGADVEVLRKKAFDTLQRLVLLVEEKTVVTRVCLFAPCAFSLLRMVVLGICDDLFALGHVNPNLEAKGRRQPCRPFVRTGRTKLICDWWLCVCG
jgi:hypothetical protein